MTALWINEEKLTDAFLEETGHHMKIAGKIKSVYYIGDFAEGSYVELNKNFLLEFLKKQNIFPLYCTFAYYTDEVEDIESQLAEQNIPYTLDYLEETRTYYDFSGKHQYHPPRFSVKASDARLLEVLLEYTYGLAASNEFYSISYTDNLSFQLEEVVEWRRKRKRSVAIFNADDPTTFITIAHDGQGFYLYSNDKKYSTVEKLCENLPERSVITQINDVVMDSPDIEDR